MKTKKHKKPKRYSVPTWITLPIDGETVDVLKVWELNDAAHQWPELAILRAYTAKAEQLLKDDTTLRTFLNQNTIFSKNVNRIGQRVSVPAGTPCNPPHTDFPVMHGKASTAHVVRVPCFEK